LDPLNNITKLLTMDPTTNSDDSKILYTEDDIMYLRGRWFEFQQTVNQDLKVKYWQIFDVRYREPQRFYHNFFHLRKLYEFYDTQVLPLILSEDKQKAATAINVF
jgi:hypothetical protein